MVIALDHYRLEVLSYTVFSPFLFRSLMTAGWVILVGGSGQDVHLIAGLIVQRCFLFDTIRRTVFRFTQIVCYEVGLSVCCGKNTAKVDR